MKAHLRKTSGEMSAFYKPELVRNNEKLVDMCECCLIVLHTCIFQVILYRKKYLSFLLLTKNVNKKILE